MLPFKLPIAPTSAPGSDLAGRGHANGLFADHPVVKTAPVRVDHHNHEQRHYAFPNRR
jgi:hypothetical protein